MIEMVVFNDFSTYHSYNYVRSLLIPYVFKKKKGKITFNQNTVNTILDKAVDVLPDTLPKEKEELHWLDEQNWSQLGIRMTSTGLAILAVPDPLPVVDEIVGFTLVFGGLMFQLYEKLK